MQTVLRSENNHKPLGSSESTTRLFYLSGTTEVLDINGSRIMQAEVKRRCEAGEDVFVFSISPEGKPEVSRVLRASISRTATRKVRVTLDNGERLEGTLDQPIMLRDGTYKA